MRYHKGSLGLNQIKDKAILHFVADSRYVTRSQLNSFVFFEYRELNRRVFNWRIQRLVEAGLMRKQIVPYLMVRRCTPLPAPASRRWNGWASITSARTLSGKRMPLSFR